MLPESLWLALVLAAAAGFAIPLGGLLALLIGADARSKDTGPRAELFHAIVAFGGGALLSAVCLVLVPEGIAHVPPAAALFWLGAGGVAFMFADRALKSRGGGAAQLMAMLLDFVPEAMALGAILASDRTRAMLLALLIALQNLPEGFNAYREVLAAHKIRPWRLLALFAALACIGPASAAFGLLYLESHAAILGALMLFSGGGILYLMFQDIAPQAVLERHWVPPLGAVAGFMLGLAGYLYLP